MANRSNSSTSIIASPMDADELERKISEIAAGCGIVLVDGRLKLDPEPTPDGHFVEQRGYSDAVWPWRRLMAECVSYLSVQSLMFQGLVSRTQNDSRKPYLRAGWSLSTKAALDARCVLHLCDYGFVVQAGIVARSCIEAVEALAAFTVEPESAERFVSAQTPGEANNAWYSLIRQKARRTIDDVLSEIAGDDPETKNWKEHIKRVQGGYAHSGFMTPALNIFLQWEEGRNGHPLLPARTTDCVESFQIIACTCFEYASVVLWTLGKQAESMAGGDHRNKDGNSNFFDELWLDSYAAHGHKFVQRLWLFFLEQQDHAPFSNWRASIKN